MLNSRIDQQTINLCKGREKCTSDVSYRVHDTYVRFEGSQIVACQKNASPLFLIESSVLSIFSLDFFFIWTNPIGAELKWKRIISSTCNWHKYVNKIFHECLNEAARGYNTWLQQMLLKQDNKNSRAIFSSACEVRYSNLYFTDLRVWSVNTKYLQDYVKLAHIQYFISSIG